MILNQVKNIKNKKQATIFFAIILFVAYCSFSVLVKKPALFVDEGITVEIARNFLNSHALDIEVAPKIFFGKPYLLQSTGYPVTIPLSGFFFVFGLGPEQARIFMIFWMFTVLFCFFYLGKKLFGENLALLSTILVATLASFYGVGRLVVGEVPGLIFLLVGFYFWHFRSKYFYVGLLWGLAVVSKPSVFIPLIPISILLVLLERGELLKKIFKIALGMIPVGLTWIFLNVPYPFKTTAWKDLISFYGNPYGTSPSDQIIMNFKDIFHSTTLLYFGSFFILIFISRCILRNEKLFLIYNTVILYSLFSFFYYLRSPGWLRYIFVAELMILFVLPHALFVIIDAFQKRFQLNESKAKLGTYIIVVSLAIFQAVHFFTISDIRTLDTAPTTIKYLNVNYKDSSVAVFNALEVSSFLKTKDRYNILNLVGLDRIGQNPLLQNKFPDLILLSKSDQELSEKSTILNSKYRILRQLGDWNLYGLIEKP